MKMDAALLDRACEYALSFDGNNDQKPDMNTQGVVIVRGGAIVKECYAKDKGPDDFATSWSAAKSFASTLIGIAIDDQVHVPSGTPGILNEQEVAGQVAGDARSGSDGGVIVAGGLEDQ